MSTRSETPERSTTPDGGSDSEMDPITSYEETPEPKVDREKALSLFLSEGQKVTDWEAVWMEEVSPMRKMLSDVSTGGKVKFAKELPEALVPSYAAHMRQFFTALHPFCSELTQMHAGSRNPTVIHSEEITDITQVEALYLAMMDFWYSNGMPDRIKGGLMRDEQIELVGKLLDTLRNELNGILEGFRQSQTEDHAASKEGALDSALRVYKSVLEACLEAFTTLRGLFLRKEFRSHRIELSIHKYLDEPEVNADVIMGVRKCTGGLAEQMMKKGHYKSLLDESKILQ
ncbi:hypothetical protein BJ508DRAFT_127483 [Ascobolus immersus RN42]|uniref:Uncharacterized protein n=1 Tax=Ascobolus immersus RN42 TaxID=1160509 RepID=A0A3N4H7A4_ASCIM|nr:hypothetical protein BJ508DRAFT_127483 [Ascobolus immersus RN42]